MFDAVPMCMCGRRWCTSIYIYIYRCVCVCTYIYHIYTKYIMYMYLQVVYIESPGSHTFELVDVGAYSDLAHRLGAKV